MLEGFANGGTTGITPTPTTAGGALWLGQNVPNPFNPSTQLRFTVGRSQHVAVRIFDASGRQVRQLLDRRVAAGSTVVMWDGRDDHGVPVASGVYTTAVSAGAALETNKIVLIR